MEERNKAIIKVMIILGILLGICVLRAIYISGFSKLGFNQYNKRLILLENRVLRGNFYDINGTALTENINDIRDYIFDGRYNTSVGYLEYGEYGLEKNCAKILLSPTYNFWSIITNLFTKEKFTGHDIHLTLDNNLQSTIEKSFKDKNGAAVVIEPKTGQIRAIYSSPNFNPNIGATDFEEVLAQPNNPLLNRATQGLYPPGSIFKILLAYAIIEEFPESYQNITYDCTGEINVDGNTISCYNHNAHGTINLNDAFKYSCNTYFVNLSQYISYKKLANIAKNFLFNTYLPTTTPVKVSQFDKKDDNTFSKYLSYIGQGKTLVTPFHMAMIASMIANNGVLMEPYMIDYIDSKKTTLPIIYDSIIEEEMAKKLQDLMIGVVNGGTGRALSNINATIGIKTGTAENEGKNAHSWVIGFAQDRENTLAFSVIVENEEGSSIDITKNIIQNFLENNRN
ncbi:hypothetical protein AN642_01515 [Epulopiscium sp. SCG-B10WGA-EpuloA2]|nr:hypothetical protein AN642_01515 [Epulopiscium sp. SCG-B10WGA-EpuloA2]